MKVKGGEVQITSNGNQRTAVFEVDGIRCNLYDYPTSKAILIDCVTDRRGNVVRENGNIKYKLSNGTYKVKYILKTNNLTLQSKFIYIEFKEKGTYKIIHIDTSLWSAVLPDFLIKVFTDTKKIENFSLLFNKAALFNHKEENKGPQDFDFLNFFYQNEKLKYWPGMDGFKAGLTKVNYNAIQKRQRKAIEAQGFLFAPPMPTIPNAIELQLTNSFRLIAGMGNESVYENGMTLHHIYGIPYIPGSAIKGITRNWIISNCHDSNEKKALKEDKLFSYLFGKGGDGDEDGNKGNAFFFDAFPTAVPSIEPDVMNNHYQSYYDKKTPPADWISPNPVFFLTVKDGKFCFQIGLKRNISCEQLKTEGQLKEDENLLIYKLPESRIVFNKTNNILDIISAWLKDALAHHGIGAKTAVGYGRIK